MDVEFKDGLPNQALVELKCGHRRRVLWSERKDLEKERYCMDCDDFSTIEKWIRRWG